MQVIFFTLLIRLAEFLLEDWKFTIRSKKARPTHFVCQTLHYPLNSEGLAPVTLRKKREK